MEDTYKNMGYDSRNDYLNSVADDYGVDENIVIALADILGEGEDFDGLISMIEDYGLGL